MNAKFRRLGWNAILAAAFSIVAAGGAAADDIELRLTVVDADTDDPIACRVYLNAADGTPYYFSSDSPAGSAVAYKKRNWINDRSVEYHTSLSAHPAIAEVPRGQYTLAVERGHACHRHLREIDLSDSETNRVDVRVRLKRWDNPADRGWYSGDTHLHRSITELRTAMLAEDLNVAMPLTYWVTSAGTPPSAGDKKSSGSVGDELIRVDDSHVIWPRNTEYEIVTVGGRRHTLGALFALGHSGTLEATVPPWKPVVVDATRRSERRPLFDFDKLDWPFAMVLPTVAPGGLVEIANNHVWRTEFAFRDWNSWAPGFLRPPWGAAEGGERAWIDYTMGMYHTLLNCGFRLPPSAGTASGVHPVPPGFGRVYVHLEDGFDYGDWIEGLRNGRSFVTTGPMLDVTADGKRPGATFEIEGGVTSIPLTLETRSATPLLYGELIVNGRPAQLLRPQNREMPDGGYLTQLKTSVRPERSGWFAVRFWEERPPDRIRFAHTAPWYVRLPDLPVRPSYSEKKYLVDRVRDEMQRSRGIVSAAAMAEYEGALESYRSLEIVDDSDEVAATARPLNASNRDRWLDNMIIHHRFSAEEVRRATGLSFEDAEREIVRRRDVAGQGGVAVDRRADRDALRVLPYPGGRHPRRGFLEGAIRPQREAKVSVFTPWDDGGYVVVDVPEAIFSNLGLTYLAHTHIPTIWDRRSIVLPKLEWKPQGDDLVMRRELPGGIVFTSRVTRGKSWVPMEIELTNGTDQPLSGLRVQVCAMLKGAIGFNDQQTLETVTRGPMIAVRGRGTDRWIISAWRPTHRAWSNPPVPCIHSDPMFPDCDPGKTVRVRGGLWFYEGTDIDRRLERLAVRME